MITTNSASAPKTPEYRDAAPAPPSKTSQSPPVVIIEAPEQAIGPPGHRSRRGVNPSSDLARSIPTRQSHRQDQVVVIAFPPRLIRVMPRGNVDLHLELLKLPDQGIRLPQG